MKRVFKYVLGCLIMASVPMTFIGCSEEQDFSQLSSANYPSKIEFIFPDNIRPLIYLDGQDTKVLPLIKGEKIALGANIMPDNVTFRDVVWSSSNEEVATVDNQGNLVAVSGDGTGYSVIEIAPDANFSGSNIAATLKVTVANELIEAESLTLTAPADQVYAGEKLQFSVSIVPEDATYKTVKWTSSNEDIAIVDDNGLVTGIVNDEVHAKVTITATSLDGAGTTVSKEITVNQIVQPQDVTLDQKYSLENGYGCAIADKKLKLGYQTVPIDCTTSLIEWKSSNNAIATVEGGVVTFNQNGEFGEVTITATCPETGKADAITLSLEAGLVRELFHDKDNYGWYNAKQSGNGTSSSHEWHDGYLTITTYMQNATTGRADIKCWNPHTWLHAGNYPIFAVRMDDVKDIESTIKSRNLNFDAVGKSASGKEYKAIANGNNKYKYDYKCSDGSHVFIYDLSEQACGTGGLIPTNETVDFTTLQFKYADMKNVNNQIQYNLYWIQTFKSLDELNKYITEVEGLTFENIKK